MVVGIGAGPAVGVLDHAPLVRIRLSEREFIGGSLRALGENVGRYRRAPTSACASGVVGHGPRRMDVIQLSADPSPRRRNGLTLVA